MNHGWPFFEVAALVAMVTSPRLDVVWYNRVGVVVVM